MKQQGKRMTSRLAGMLLLAAIGTTAVAGCGGDEPAAKEAGQGGQEETPKKDWTKEAVELTYYYMYSDDIEKSFYDDYGSLIQKKYPNFTFKFLRNTKGSTLADVVAAKTPIDFFGGQIADIYKLKDVDMLGNVSDLVDIYKLDMGRLEPVVIDVMKEVSGGAIPGFPVKINSLTLAYNKDLFDKFGVPYLTDEMTWDQVADVARRLTRNEGGTAYYGLGLNSSMHLVSQAPPPLLDRQTQRATVATDYWNRMLKRLVPLASLADDAEIRSKLANYSSAYSMFHKDRTVAIQVILNSAYSLSGSGADMNYDFARFPSFSDMRNAGPQPAPFYYFVSKNSPNREAAFLALSELVTDESQAALAKRARVPVLKDKKLLEVLGNDEPLLKGKNAKALVPKQYGQVVGLDQMAAQANSAVLRSFYEVVAGKKDVNSALRDAEEAANKKIEALLKQ
ncbi:ABC transporter substrate-binding protein [Paenibacillus oceani]|uniref:Extracellular solute-binding protein n=1 Tax=Paenibacillus oceani TaxID=2772510 RepID=A0A927H2Q0_9BACL|nr:extracellular solute-binding protein [Paenibacillus oceani]MBD2865593.1 extracellular solute-binding protein [Paenibacillus oceani]